MIGKSSFEQKSFVLSERIIKKLRIENKTLSIAESVTGGLICSTLTNIPGSSGAIAEGLVTYTKLAKTKRLAIHFEEDGVISESTARKMADSVRLFLPTTYGLGITGNAGPTVDQENTSVGLVYVAVGSAENTCSKSIEFSPSLTRKKIKEHSVLFSLELLWSFLSTEIQEANCPFERRKK